MLLALINSDAILSTLPMHLVFKIDSLISFIGQGDYKKSCKYWHEAGIF